MGGRSPMQALVHSSAAAAESLLRQVHCLDATRELLSDEDGLDDSISYVDKLGALRGLEQQTLQLQRSHAEWPSLLVGRGPEVADCRDGARNVLSGNERETGNINPDMRAALPHAGLTPLERGAALASALQQTAFRLERLHGRLKGSESPLNSTDGAAT